VKRLNSLGERAPVPLLKKVMENVEPLFGWRWTKSHERGGTHTSGVGESRQVASVKNEKHQEVGVRRNQGDGGGVLWVCGGYE